MNYLVIGQGGREHAIVRALKLSTRVKEVHALPGNAGMALEVLCHPLQWKEFEKVHELCVRLNIDVVVIGPEDPLVFGLSDFLREKNILVVGPSKHAAQLEGSKIFAKEFMLQYGVATASAKTVYSVEETMRFSSEFTPPYVLKADGLAGGKGVVICQTLEQLKKTAQLFFDEKQFGVASEKALLEQFLPGYELSLIFLTDGNHYELLPLAQDHKQLSDGDQGPNTGGMGTIAPMQITAELESEIKIKIIDPTIQGLKDRKLFYRGVIFLGLMLTEQGPLLLEYNCRMGDPETQVLMPLLNGDWGEVFYQLAQGNLQELNWKKIFSACVVMAAPGYPDKPEKNVKINGDLGFQSHSSYFLHAGTAKNSEGEWVTSGGRVICAVGIGTNKSESLRNAYDQVTHIQWKGMQIRKDIGQRKTLLNIFKS